MMRVSARFALVLLLFVAVPASAAQWRVPGDFATIQDAINDAAVQDGDTILVGPGNLAGALVNKSVHIKGIGKAVIDDGPAHSSGLIQGFRLLGGSGGTTISHLIFTVDLDIMNGEAVDDVTVTQNTFLNAIQAVSNWRGSRWEISHNVITDLRTRDGGGIGILVGDYLHGYVSDNVVSHNKITGTLHVSPDDGGGYNGTGIVLYADYRYGRTGTIQMDLNRIVQNTIGLTSDTPAVVDVVAIELTDTRDDGLLPTVILNNAVGFNDLRRTAIQLDLTPDNLDQHNDISRNLGENRGHGLHPALFGPGGQ